MLGAAHGCDHVYGQSEAFFTCMRNVDAAALINTSSNISNMFQTLWAFPRVETTFGVLPDHPVRILAKGQFNDVDTIRGYNSHEEGLIKIDNYSRKVQTKEAFAKALRETLEPYAIPDLEGLIRQFLDIYIGNTTDPSFIGQQASRAVADLSFAGPTLTELYLTTGSSDRNKHYLYRFDYRDSFRRGPPWIGAVHMDELKYIFGLDQLHPSIFSLRDRVATQADYSIVDQMMTLWSNFARTGNPTVNMSTLQWEPFSNRKPKMLMINKSPTVADFSRSEVVRLYETILKVGLFLIGAINNLPYVIVNSAASNIAERWAVFGLHNLILTLNTHVTSPLFDFQTHLAPGGTLDS
ncbi:carboxylic ester hydrolase [Plakobranchus ocellatus]|uniref:Carboxylic ester hydrolase n=1 Tax=Plakobranchus ocellatus TaxID=259542 RepID=A0AAV4DIJ9_9GAST|nr:carboxylic ester hydrolase [Plakobranchus ocellatus]